MTRPRHSSSLPGSRGRSSLRRSLTCGVPAIVLAVGLSGTALADNLDTMDTWDGSTIPVSWGTLGAPTFGQIITVDKDSTLNSFSFELAWAGGIALQYRAYVYEWDASTIRATGNALYVSDIKTAPNSSDFTTVTIDTGAAKLSGGKTYVIFFSISSVIGQGSGEYLWGAVLGNPYADGSFVLLTNGEDEAALTTSHWFPVPEYDLAFKAILNALRAEGGDNAPGMQQPTRRLMNGFMTTMLNPAMPSRMRPVINPLGYADSQSALSDDEKSAFAVALHGEPEKVAKPMVVWGSGYGGYNRTDGGSSSHDTQSRAYGVASGLDYWISSDTMVGFALGAGHLSWGVEGGNGGGEGTILQGGLYARQAFGSFYLSGALAGSYQDMHTQRTSGATSLEADYDAFNIGGRIEGGYNLAASSHTTFTPYAAVQAQWLHTPSYSEDGSSPQALSFDESDTIAPRAELGIWVNRSFTLESGKPFSLFARLGWAHNFDNDADLTAAFKTVAGSDFTVSGDQTARNLALITAGAEIDFDNGWSVNAKLDGEIGGSSQTYEASGRLSYRW